MPLNNLRWVILLSAALMAGCAATPTVLKLKPPVDLMQDCPVPVVDVTKNKGLIEGLLAYAGALDQCNNDKKALREWDRKE